MHAQQAGSLDASFSPGYGVDGDVNALAEQTDGKIIVAGQFAHVNGVPCQNLARLNTDGSVDDTFTPPSMAGEFSFVSPFVRAVVVQPDGHILVGGYFAQVDGATHANLIRLNADGSLDTGFTPSFVAQPGSTGSTYGGVYALAVQPDGRIVAAGTFNLVDGQTRRGAARINADGSLDTGFDPSMPANVYPAQGLDSDAFALALSPNGDVYVAGYFATINGVARPNLARLRASDGRLDTGFAPVLGSYPTINTIACQADGLLLVAGAIDQTGITYSGGDLVRFKTNGDADPAFSMRHGNSGGQSSDIQAIMVLPRTNTILVAGDHLYADGHLVGALARYLSDGSQDTSFYSGLDPHAATSTAPTASALLMRTDGAVIVGGSFDTVDGEFRHNLAGLLGSPAANCPVAMLKAAVPIAIAGAFESPAVQDGKFTVKIQEPASDALAINFSAAGNPNVVDTDAFSDVLTIPAGALKTKLRVHPSTVAALFVGRGKKITLTLDAGRGYIVGGSGTAKVHVVPDGAATN